MAASRARTRFGLGTEPARFYRPHELPDWFRGVPEGVVTCMWERERDKALLVVFEDPFEHLADHAVSAWMAMLKGDRADETRAWPAADAGPRPQQGPEHIAVTFLPQPALDRVLRLRLLRDAQDARRAGCF